MVKAEEFITQLQQDQIVAAIRAAELKTSGEVRVFITRQPVEAPVTAAQAQFEALGLKNTSERNGVLLFVAPESRQFAIIGDIGIHTHCGDAFWREVADELTAHFQRAEFTLGITHAIRKAGDLLALHFPRKADDKNELADDVVHD